jgi:hypothetical protein
MIYSKRYVETVCRSLHDWWDSTTNEELKNIWRKHISEALEKASEEAGELSDRNNNKPWWKFWS